MERGSKYLSCGSRLTIHEDRERYFHIFYSTRDMCGGIFPFHSSDEAIFTEKEGAHIDCCLKCSSAIISQIEEYGGVFPFVFFEDFRHILSRIVIKRKKFYKKCISDKFI